ncbi:hypothetical protein KVR01_002042 [Diaporthe batatas]|uniref:uncharacterized protein n=1 Tax=Diaporthe batatas TaxID=748121 RepID=UPI001D04C1B9|nr:uncharacterized protein KVR01_002042 [Diaporthe batatas]KAG8166353.1 hypothetical protein KVR01_002042 [Diaporthe batatas]
MGANSSKPSGTQPPHVWKGSSPASVSHEMVESLQSSPETDASRAQLAELQVQARVASELRKLQHEEEKRLRELTDKLASAPGDDSKQPSVTRHEVSKDVQALRAKLEQRKGVREVPEAVEAARGDVVRCLRENDRRPLDCWREVERFREEVRRLEKGWVEKVVS